MEGKVFANYAYGSTVNQFECIDLATGKVLYNATGSISNGAHLPGNPFASALAELLFSKALDYIKRPPTQLLSQIEGIVTQAAKQIPVSNSARTLITNCANIRFCSSTSIL